MSQAIIDGDVEKLVDITENMGYDATLEIHGRFWRKIRKIRPDAKYLIIIRPYEKWQKSIVRFCSWIFTPIKRYPLLAIPFFYRFNLMIVGMNFADFGETR